jgi:site-specific recombinase XerC
MDDDVHPRIQRRRDLASSLNFPADLRETFGKFTEGERAVLKIISGEVERHGACTLTKDAIADLSSVSYPVVKVALRTAKAEGLIKVERGQTGRFLEFFAATIRNKNTRMAYYRAVTEFFAWADRYKVGQLADIEPLHVAAYIEALGARMAKPTVKQHLAAVRMCFDWLVTGGVLTVNPAHAVRGPKHVVKRGKTPVLTTDQARVLLDSIDTSTLVGLRDRALIGVMTYAFARVGAVVAMRVEDYFANGKRWWVRLHEKNGKRHEMPAHHKLEAFLDEYVRAAGIAGDEKSPLFRSAVRRTGTLAATAMHRVDAWRMVQRRSAELGMKVKIGCHALSRRIQSCCAPADSFDDVVASAGEAGHHRPDRHAGHLGDFPV